MEHFTRFAVYFAPRPGPFADRAAQWLGRDPVTGASVVQPEWPALPALADLTRAPRKYGFHATLRAPFRPAPDVEVAEIVDLVAALAARLPPARADGLALVDLHGFLALVPQGDCAQIDQLAVEVVRTTNPLRAALTPAEIARRRPDNLSARARANLAQWGYPFVMQDFQFHLTLSDALAPDLVAPLMEQAGAHFGPVLPSPFIVQDLCLFAEDMSGLFHLLHRFPLQG